MYLSPPRAPLQRAPRELGVPKQSACQRHAPRGLLSSPDEAGQALATKWLGWHRRAPARTRPIRLSYQERRVRATPQRRNGRQPPGWTCPATMRRVGWHPNGQMVRRWLAAHDRPWYDGRGAGTYRLSPVVQVRKSPGTMLNFTVIAQGVAIVLIDLVLSGDNALVIGA